MITMEKLMALKGVNLFSKTDDNALVKLAALTTAKNISAGTTVIKKGDVSTAMFVIVRGKMKVHEGNNVIAHLKDGDVFGEIAALSPEVRIASVTAIDDTTVLVIDRDVLYNVMSLSMGLVKGIIEVLCQRARSLADLLRAKQTKR